MVLGQVQCEVVGSQIALDGVQSRDTRTPWWSLPVVVVFFVIRLLVYLTGSFCVKH